MADKLDWVREWFKKGDNDFIAATLIMNDSKPPTDTVCFHTQQCAEKYLKGYLTLNDITIEKTHDLVKINNQCRKIDPDFAQLTEACEMLTGYAVEVRYPGDFCDYPVEEAREAIGLAEKIRNFVLGKIKNIGGS